MGKTNIPDGYKCSLIVVEGVVMNEENGAGNLAAFTPPDNAAVWRLEFSTGDVGITDGKVLVVYGKRAEAGKTSGEHKILHIPGKSPV